MKLVLASDFILDKDPAAGSPDNEEFNLIARHYLDAFDQMILCSPVPPVPSAETDSALQIRDRRMVSQPLPPLNGTLSIFHFRYEALRILKQTLQHGDVLIARLPSETGLLAIHAARELNKPWAVEVIGTAEEYCDNSFGKLLSPIVKHRMQKAVRHAPVAMYATNRFLQSCYPCMGRVVSCSPVHIPTLSAEVDMARLDRISTCFDREVYRIGLYGGTLGPAKGIDTALYALNKVRQLTIKKVQLDIIGSGDSSRWRRMAEDLGINDCVSFNEAGSSGSSMDQWLDGLDVYIQPSRRESAPAALMKAMSRGLPVFGSKVGGITELLAPEQLMQPEDDNRLAMLICDLLNDITKQRRMSGRSMETISAYTAGHLHVKRQEFFDYIINKVMTRHGRREFVESNPYDY